MSETQSKGAEYKARREALGWDADQMAPMVHKHWTQGATCTPRYVAGCIAGCEVCPDCYSAEFLAAYDAALDEAEAEARREVRDGARRMLAECRRVKRFDDLAVESRGFILTHMGPLVAAWDASGFETPEEKAAEDAILAALAKLAEEPEVAAELVITDEMRADARYALDSGRIWDFAYKHFGDKSQPPTHSPAYEALRARVQAIADSVPAADPDPMPKPPEGVTVERESERFVVVLGSERTGARCVVPRDEQRAMWLGGQPVTRAFLRYAADLAEWASRQHTRTQEAAAGAERARLLDAVRVAEEAVRVALEARRAADAVFQEAIAAEGAAVRDLARARKAAGLG